MAQGEFTKQEAKEMKDAVSEMFKALSKSKQMDYFGHWNGILLFIDAAGRVAPNESEHTKSNQGIADKTWSPCPG